MISLKLEELRCALEEPADDHVPQRLIEDAARLKQDAIRIGMPALMAHAALIEARALTRAERYDDALSSIDWGRSRLGEADPYVQAVDLDLREAELWEQRALQEPSHRSNTADYWSRALAACERSVAVVEEARLGADAPYLQAGYMRGRSRLYQIGARAKLALGDPAGALRLADLLRSRGLPIQEQPCRLDPQLLQKYRMTAGGPPRQRMKAWRRLMRKRAAPNPYPGIDLEAARLGIENDQAVIVWFWLAQDALLIAVLDRNSTVVKTVLVPSSTRRHMQELAEVVLEMPKDSSAATAALNGIASQDIVELLLPSWVRELALKRQRLVLCPHGLLHGLPLQALPTAEGALGLTRGLSFIPSLASLVAHQATAPSGLAAIWATQFPAGPCEFGPLPEARTVASKGLFAAQKAGGPTIAIDADKQGLKRLFDQSDSGKLRHVRQVWFCCHGRNLEEESPLESRLELGMEPLDGLDLATLDLAADLVVLFACHAGRRAVRALGLNELPGDDLLGLQGALRLAGARQVLAPQWPVQASLMGHILPALNMAKHGSIDVALSSALKKYVDGGLKTGRRPYRWAPLQLFVFGKSSASEER